MQKRVDQLDAAFPMAGVVALDPIQRSEIADQWLAPSTLPKMSVGALACHLGRQVIRAAELLPVTTNAPPLDSVYAHYHQAAWVTSRSPDDPPNDRSAADDLALSVCVPTPEVPAEVFAPVRDLLVRLAVRRHGQAAVISTLTRAERTQVISAF